MSATNRDENDNKNTKNSNNNTAHGEHGENLFSCEMKFTLFNSFSLLIRAILFAVSYFVFVQMGKIPSDGK